MNPRVTDHVTIIGAGTIGASMTALLTARGIRVTLFDPSPSAEVFLRRAVSSAWQSLQILTQLALEPASYAFLPSIEAACADAGFVFEATPEKLEAKRRILGQIDACTPAEIVIATSTSSFLTSDLQHGMRSEGRLIAAHPFNPPHLMPLVEISGGQRTHEWALEWAYVFFKGLGRRPIRMQREAVGHIANRLAAALYREAVSLVVEGTASVADVDNAIRFGPGLRWAVMGPHMLYHLGAGDGGYRQYLAHLGSAQEARWRELGNPVLSPEVCEKLIEGVEAEAADRDLETLRHERDNALIAMLGVLRLVQ